MRTTIHSELDLEQYEGKLPLDHIMIHFKMVGIGPNTITEAEQLGKRVCDRVRSVPGFFLISKDGVGLREAMHDLVDRFCDTQEGVNEPKI